MKCSRYKATINRINEEESNKIVGFSRPAHPTKQSEFPAQYIPRDQGSPPRGMTSSCGRTSSTVVSTPRDMTTSAEVEQLSVTSPMSVSPVSEEGGKRESSCSDSGVDVTSLSIC